MTVSTVDIANENLTPEMKTAIRRLEKLAAATSPSTGQGVTYSAMMGHTLVDDSDITTLAQLDILSQEARVQAQQLGKDEARNLVDSYYEAQERRKASSNQVRSLGASGEPVLFVDFFSGLDAYAEKKFATILAAYADSIPAARWAQSILGVGPIIAAGLVAHIDIEKAPTVGHIWRYAGYDPTQKWLGTTAVTKIVKEHLNGKKPTEKDVAILAEKVGGLRADTALRMATTDKKDNSAKPLTEKNLTAALSMRPWNASLKTLCWKIGESFVKVKNNPKDFYGKILDARKQLEEQRNENGEFADQAAHKLATTNIGKTTDAYKWYSVGKLPPAHIHSRAKRYAVKLFLAHFHHVAYEAHYGTPPPKPYVIDQLKHGHYMPPPMMDN